MELEKDRWSKNLFNITPRIERLYYKGMAELLLDDKPKLAIVGSRHVTDYGVRVIEKWMPEIVAAGITVVSGFMYGVDQVAHRACLENGGKTIAVLGWGIEKNPANDDVEIYEKIIENGSLILSEYEGKCGGNTWTFPARNRIVAGISDAVLVVEAAEKSGSLITARLAGKYDKKLMAVPGMVTSKVAEGTNELIKTGKAGMVTTAAEIIRGMGLSSGQVAFDWQEININPILAILQREDKSVDELAALLRISIPEVLGKLTELSLAGKITERAGKVGVV